MGKTNPKHAAVNAHQEPTRSSYNSWITSSHQEVSPAPLRALNYEEKWKYGGGEIRCHDHYTSSGGVLLFFHMKILNS